MITYAVNIILNTVELDLTILVEQDQYNPVLMLLLMPTTHERGKA